MDKITEQDLANRGVKGLPDVPGLTTEEMQRKLEEIAREILIPKVNELVEGLNNANSNFLGKNISSDFTVTNISDFVAYKVGNMVVFSFTCIDSTKDCKITTVKHKPILNSGYFATCYQAWANKDYQCVLSGACLTDGTIVDFKGTYNLPYPFISGRNIIYFT